jgi:hypothetical protein
MGSQLKSNKKTIISELAEAISSFNIAEIAALLSEEGEFEVQTENNEIVLTGKDIFLAWLRKCHGEFISACKSDRRLNFTVVKSLHSVAGNPIIIFENGRFPFFLQYQGEHDKSGFIIKADEEKITGIDLCLLVMKTENPFIYEKKLLRQG